MGLYLAILFSTVRSVCRFILKFLNNFSYCLSFLLWNSQTTLLDFFTFLFNLWTCFLMTFGIVSYKNVSDLILIQDSFLRIVMFSFHLLKVKPNAITVLVDCTSILLKFFWVNRYVSGGPYLLSFIFYLVFRYVSGGLYLLYFFSLVFC